MRLPLGMIWLTGCSVPSSIARKMRLAKLPTAMHGAPMTRAMQVAMSEQEVIAKCLAESVSVSAIEPLPSGGVRLVCSSVHGAEVMRLKFKSKIISEEQARERHRPVSPLW